MKNDDLETKTEEIVESMMYVSDKIQNKSLEIASLRNILYSYKRSLQELYPNEDINIVEYLTKQKILERRNTHGTTSESN